MDFIEQYTEWIRNNSSQRFINGYTEITAPFVDAHNDDIQFYIRQDGTEYVLTDDGYILSDLQMNGCDMKSSKRRQLLLSVSAMLGVTIIDDCIMMRVKSADLLPTAMHTMIQSMLKISDIFFTHPATVRGIFLEDVRNYFMEKDIRSAPSVMFSGKSGLLQRFDFVIPASRKQPERLVTTINRPTRQAIQSAIFAWRDVQPTRGDKTMGFLFLNDSESRNESLSDAAKQYDMQPVWWSMRDNFVDVLSA